MKRSRQSSLAWVGVAYVTAAVAAWALCRLRPDLAGWQQVAAADLLATAVVFAFSWLLNNSSVYDPYWSVAPLVVAPLLAAFGHGTLSRRLLCAGLVVLWGLRLTWNWVRGWSGLHHEDWRYVNLRQQTGRGYWLVSLLGLHLMPTLSVLLGMMPLLAAMDGQQPLGLVDGAALLLTGAAILTETIADEQLRSFRRQATAGEILDRGLWSRCRHPNYLGEIGFWWGLWLFGVAAEPQSAGPRIAGAAWITVMFVWISIPMIDKRSLARRPGYAAQLAELPALLPIGRRKS